MNIPEEIWCMITPFMEPKSINSLMIILAYKGDNTKSILRQYILKRLDKYTRLIDVFNNLDNINTTRKYIYNYNKIYKIDGVMFDRYMFSTLALHLIRSTNSEKSRKFKNIIGYENRMLHDYSIKTNGYMLIFIKCI